MGKPLISLIAAMDKNRVIGVNGRIPWHLPDDMRWFKEKTMGKPVIMGRKTYESIPVKFRPLSGRKNIILTRNRQYINPHCLVVHSIEEALSAVNEEIEVMVAGGAEIYSAFLPMADRLYLTLVEETLNGDTYFPQVDFTDWQQINHQQHAQDVRHPYAFSWGIWDKKRPYKHD